MKLTAEYKELAWQGLWKNNPGIVQLLGLCPLLAVTSTLTNAIGLGLATLFVLICFFRLLTYFNFFRAHAFWNMVW